MTPCSNGNSGALPFAGIVFPSLGGHEPLRTTTPEQRQGEEDMSISPARKLLLGGLTGLAVMAIAMAPASAHKKHHKHFRWHSPVVVYSGGGGGCSFYYWKWQKTGASYWKRRYYACIY
jgi:hypothetical protein